MDVFVRGVVERFSPEAPVPIFLPLSREQFLGGAGNTARNIKDLGGEVIFCAVVGASLEENARRLLLHAGLTNALLNDPSRQTPLKTRYILEDEHLLRIDEEDTSLLSEEIRDQLVQTASIFLEQADLVVCSDYRKGTLTPEVLKSVIQCAQRQKKPVIIDPKGEDFSFYKGADFLTPNRFELSVATGMNTDNDAEVEAAAAALMERVPLQKGLLVTRGEQGVSLVVHNRPALHIPSFTSVACDVSGAGDSVVAAFAMAIANQMPFDEAAWLSNLAGSLAVQKRGISSISAHELWEARDMIQRSSLQRLVVSNPTQSCPLFVEQSSFKGSKNLTQSWLESTYPEQAEKAFQQISSWKTQGLTIGFTNGCYDILHKGHVAMLYEAKKVCDKLVVGINTDRSIARLKGEDRPLQMLDQRAAVLAAVEPVDLVIPFAEDTPMALIQNVRPHVLIKGSDYKDKPIVGREFVESYGGSVTCVPSLLDFTTTEFVHRMHKRFLENRKASGS